MSLKYVFKNAVPDFLYYDMQNQFPKEELKSQNDLNFLLLGDNFKLLLFYNQENFVGYVLYAELSFLWIDYIAVLKKHHCKGFGAEILNMLFKIYEHLEGCYFEVEPEDENVPQTLKRMKFYKRLGCFELDFKYYFPNCYKKLPMTLLYKSFDDKIPSKDKIFDNVLNIYNLLHSRVGCAKELINLMKKENLH